MIWKKHTTISQENNTIHLCYFVTAPVKPEELDRPCYGIGVSDGKDIAFDHAFSANAEEAIRFCEMLCRNQVTPVSFFEILEDYFNTTLSI